MRGVAPTTVRSSNRKWVIHLQGLGDLLSVYHLDALLNVKVPFLLERQEGLGATDDENLQS